MEIMDSITMQKRYMKLLQNVKLRTDKAKILAVKGSGVDLSFVVESNWIYKIDIALKAVHAEYLELMIKSSKGSVSATASLNNFEDKITDTIVSFIDMTR